MQKYVSVSPDNPAIVKNEALCSGCGHCYAVCQETIGVAGRVENDSCISGNCSGINVNTLADTNISPDTYANAVVNKTVCINCGQCSAACPEQAITPRNDCEYVKAAIRDPNKVVIFSTSPSVRVGLGDAFCDASGDNPAASDSCTAAGPASSVSVGALPKGEYAEGKMVSALRAVGGDYVLDVTFSADLTIMEEGTELLKRVLGGQGALPQFTSCCPAWVKFVESFHPERIANLSSAKSPIGMQGPIVKSYFAAKMDINPENIVHVAVTPCTAKKFEVKRPEMNAAGRTYGKPEMRDNDYVITTKELAQWLEEDGIDYNSLPDSQFDSIMGKGTGAGVIFGNTGGVMEAALRMAYAVVEKKPAPDTLLDFQPVRGLGGIKSANVELGGKTLKIAVIYGTKNAEKFMESPDFGTYHFAEVMTCPGGCISGAGQPQGHIIPPPDFLRQRRIASMYAEDAAMTKRNSMDNSEIQQIYAEFFKAPGSELAEALLHTEYVERK